jgi:sortase B
MKNKIRIVVPYIFLIIGICLILSVGTYLFLYFRDAKKSVDAFKDLKELVVEVPVDDEDPNDNTDLGSGNELSEHTKLDFSALLAENADFIGWLTVDGTNIDYPVMQTPDDEEYYLHRNFYKQYDYSGVPFCNAAADVERPSDNTVIYGHHMRAGTMFNHLTRFKDADFYAKHKTFTFDTIYRTGTYEIVAVCLTHANEGAFKYWEVTDCTEDEFNEYVNWLASKSLYKTDGIDDVEYGDRLVTLSTCAYHTTNGRLIVVGKLIDSDDADLINNRSDRTLENNEETIYNED